MTDFYWLGVIVSYVIGIVILYYKVYGAYKKLNFFDIVLFLIMPILSWFSIIIAISIVVIYGVWFVINWVIGSLS